MKFSSRPADMNSKDDYFVLSNNMVVLETSLAMYDMSLYKNLTSQTIPKWMRTNIANRISNSGEEWINNFFYKNSGTHNNQWLIIDFNKFEQYKNNLKSNNLRNSVSGIVYLAEQLPILDKIYSKDMTQVLIEESYVSSFNAPYFNETHELTGKKALNMTNYYEDKRYILFKKFNENVTDIESVKALIRYHDKENLNDTIAPRWDMSKGKPFGCTDGKAIDYYRIKGNKGSAIITGPSYITGVSEPFNFKKFPGYSHEGIPEEFRFKWIDV